jgi:hypothetical protein
MARTYTQKYYAWIIIFVTFMYSPAVYAQMESDNFTIDSYTLGEHGAVLSTSSNFQTSFGVTNIIYGDPDPTIDPRRRNTVYGSKPSTTQEVSQINTPPSDQNDVIESPNLELPKTINQIDPTQVLVFVPRYKMSEYIPDAVNPVILYKTLYDGFEVQITIPANAFFIPENYDEQTQGEYRVYISIDAVLVPTALLPQKEYGLSLLNDKAYQVTFFDSQNNRVDQLSAPMYFSIRMPSTLDYTIDLGGYYYEQATQKWIKLPELSFGRNTVSFLVNQPLVFGLWAGLDFPDNLNGSSASIKYNLTTTTQMYIVLNTPLIIGLACGLISMLGLIVWYIKSRRYKKLRA